MRFPLYLLGFGFVLSVAAVTAQTAQQPQTPVSPTTPANQVGDGSQSKSGTPVQPTSAAPCSHNCTINDWRSRRQRILQHHAEP